MEKNFTTIKIKNFLIIFFIITIAFFSHAQAHDLFVTVKESMSHHPGHANVVIGWGHALPMDYFLRGSKIETYAIYDPALTRMDFEFDRKANAIIDEKEGSGQKRVSGRKSHKGLTTQAGHYFGQHVKFQEDSPKGTYQVAVTSKPYQFTMWVNKKGRVKWGEKTLDEIKDAREIKVSKRHFYSGKAFLTVGEWTEPKPLGHPLEIIPMTDLSQVKVGDEVSFKVLLKGKPLSGTAEKQEMLNAASKFFGKGHKYGISALINEGTATFQVITPGQWLVSVHVLEPVKEKSGPRELVIKTLHMAYDATVTFHAK
jgi:uncharacterized GH25 family protein